MNVKLFSYIVKYDTQNVPEDIVQVFETKMNAWIDDLKKGGYAPKIIGTNISSTAIARGTASNFVDVHYILVVQFDVSKI